MEDYKQKKSVLRNKHVQELRALDKEIKKKKGVLKEQLESKRCDVVARHDQELDALAAECGVGVEPDAKLTEPESEAIPSDSLKNASFTPYYFADRDWQGLGKKELEMEAQKRGLGKKGNREELVTKLIIYHNEQKKKVDQGNIDPKNVAPSAKPRKRKGALAPSSPGDKGGSVTDAVSTSNQFLKPSVDNNGTGLASMNPKSSFVKEKGEKAVVSKSSPVEASESSSSSSDSDSDSDADSSASESSASGSQKKKAPDAGSNQGDMDTPDSQRAMGSFKQDARGAQRRGLRRTHRGNRRGKRGPGGASRGVPGAEEPEEEGGEANENAERQRKRERVMQQVLAKLTTKFPSGLSLDRLMPELANMKVANFHPSLLGYETIEDWICNQPANVIQFNRIQHIIYPPRSEELASDSSSDDSDNDE